MRANVCAAMAALMAAGAWAQDQSRPDLRQILDRLERLEDQNRSLIAEIRALRAELASQKGQPIPAEPQTEEREAVQDRRIEEHEQAKVESEHKLPVRLSGMLLFNAFANGRYSGDAMYPTVASANAGLASKGATVRQTVLGLKFDGPRIFGGGQVTGSMFMDFFAGSGASLNQLLRLRVATVDLNWKHTTVSFGQDKPIVAPREPESLAQVGLSPLTAAGNLWLWQPQARFEQRIGFGRRSGVRAQMGVYQTAEGGNGAVSEYPNTLARSRPGLEGRFEFWGDLGEQRRIEIAPSFHVSNTLANGQSVPSRIYSIDWLVRPFANFDFVGQFFRGENTGVIGGLHQGVTITGETLRAVQAYGGWLQLTYRATPRLSFNLYGGQEDDRNSDLARGAIAKNLTYAGNVMYRLGSNVLASFEASQTRTTYLGLVPRLNPHYDFALAYLF